MIYWELFISFIQVGIFSIGGGYAAMPLIQSQVVTKYGWLTMSEFTDLITIAEMTPGPIAINAATFVGIRIGGIFGAIAATFGCILPSCIILSILFFVYYRYKQVSTLQSVLGSLRPAVVALIAAAGLSILKIVAFDGGKISVINIHWLECGIFLAAFLVIRIWKKNPIIVMVCCGMVRLVLGSLPSFTVFTDL